MAKFAAIVLCIIGSTLAFTVPHIEPKVNWKIVGGEAASPGQFPFIASLKYKGTHHCGGSIINERWILSAAHCVAMYDKNLMTVVVGSNFMSKGGVEYTVEKTIPHENYGRTGYDVSLIKLATPIQLTESISTISLESENLEVVNATLSGWGTDGFPGTLPDSLQFVQLQTITVKDCLERIAVTDVATNEKEICTLMPEGKGACVGDSGSPLVYNGKVCGIVSRGFPCALGWPDMFTRVSSHVGWIQEQIEKN